MDNKIRVLSVIRYPVGGIRTYIKYTYGNLYNKKYHFTILTSDNEEAKVIKDDLKNFNLELIQVRGKRFLLSFFYNIFLTLMKNRFDIIHSHGSSSGVIVSTINCLFRVPHIITLHETFNNEILENRFLSIKKRIMSFLFSRADYINLVSHDAKDNFLNYFPSFSKRLNKVIVIRNGVDTHYFTQPVNGEKQIESDDKYFKIGFLGRFMPEKGFHILIDAIEILHNTENLCKKFKILAFGYGAFIREYKTLIKEKGLENYFDFREFQSDVRKVYREIDLLVIPSLREAFPLVAVEGLVSGTPIVATKCIGLREALKESPATLVKPGNPDELATSIMERMLIKGKDEALKFAPKAIQKYDVKNTAIKLEILFNKALSKNSCKEKV